MMSSRVSVPPTVREIAADLGDRREQRRVFGKATVVGYPVTAGTGDAANGLFDSACRDPALGSSSREGTGRRMPSERRERIRGRIRVVPRCHGSHIPAGLLRAEHSRRKGAAMRRSLLPSVAITLFWALLAACGSGDGASGTTTTTEETSTTAPTEVITTTQVPVTTTTAMATTTTTAAVATTAQVDTDSLAEGSGCTPAAGEPLPDGEWFGYVDGAFDSELDFDLACWFGGDAAARAAAEDGKESPPPNDYYVRNVNSTIRTISVSGDATVAWLPNPGDPTTEEKIPYAGWTAERNIRSYQPGVWMTIEDGEVVEIREQYVP